MSERAKAAAHLIELRDKRKYAGGDYDAVSAALDCARQAARLDTLDNLLSQLQDG
jgi:hypothetical protein